MLRKFQYTFEVSAFFDNTSAQEFAREIAQEIEEHLLKEKSETVSITEIREIE